MQLSDYLDREQILQSDFASRLGVSASTVTRWIRRERQPSLEQVVRIETETGGAVSAVDFLKARDADGAAA